MTIDRFWGSFGIDRCPDFSGLHVLEIGSGEGQRSAEMARAGSSRVVGVEPFINSYRKAMSAIGDSDVADRVMFFNGELKDLPPETFDAIISENTFEHVRDIPGLLSEIRARLKPGGKLYVAFGPLYHAPDGDHNWLRTSLPGSKIALLPWGHLIFAKTAFKRLSKRNCRQITGTIDWPFLDLNQHKASEFERMFFESGLAVAFIGRNYVKSTKAKLLSMAARFPALSDYCTLNIAAVLQKPGPEVGDAL